MQTGDDYMDIRERLRSVPRSYEDFVNYTARYMEQNDTLRDVILTHIDSHPEANSGDVLRVLVDFLGLGEALEVVPDEDVYAVGGMRAAY